MDRVLTDFIQAVRGAQVRVSVAEALEAHEVVRVLGYDDREALREGLGVTLAKTIDEKARFFAAFDRYLRTLAATGDRPKVMGSRIDIAPTGPMPGRTPIRVPTSTPMKQARRFGS